MKKRKHIPRVYYDAISCLVSWEEVLRVVGITASPKVNPNPVRYLKLKCCFHKEKTPSMYLYKSGTFICYSCGVIGDIFGFIMRLKEFDYWQTVDFFKKHFKITPDNFQNFIEARIKEVREEVIFKKDDSLDTLPF